MHCMGGVAWFSGMFDRGFNGVNGSGWRTMRESRIQNVLSEIVHGGINGKCECKQKQALGTNTNIMCPSLLLKK